jgi:hypothetical protein
MALQRETRETTGEHYIGVESESSLEAAPTASAQNSGQLKPDGSLRKGHLAT